MNFRKITAALLACAVTAAAAPVYSLTPVLTASASEAASSGTCGDNAVWTLDENGLLTISGTGAIADTLFAGTPWESSAVKKAVIEPGITAIERTAFMNCSEMTEITIPDTVTSIGLFAFLNCSSLKTADISANVENIGICAFSSCDAIESINVAEDNKFYTDIDGILFNKDMTEILCYPQQKKADSYVIPDTVTAVGNSAFNGNSYLKSITIPSSVTLIKESGFSDCSRLTRVSLPESVAELEEYAFFNCESLASVFFYNPDCIIADYSYTICNTSEFSSDDSTKYNGYFSGKINGLEDSTAQTYANKYGYTFLRMIPIAQTKGDVDGDSFVNSSDASLVLSEYARIATGAAETFSAAQKNAADVNSDNAVDSSDASLILAYYAYTSTGGTGTIEDYLS